MSALAPTPVANPRIWALPPVAESRPHRQQSLSSVLKGVSFFLRTRKDATAWNRRGKQRRHAQAARSSSVGGRRCRAAQLERKRYGKCRDQRLDAAGAHARMPRVPTLGDHGSPWMMVATRFNAFKARCPGKTLSPGRPGYNLRVAGQTLII